MAKHPVMKELLVRPVSISKQYLLSVLFVSLISGLCFSLSDFLNYRIVALLLLAAVSFIAMFFDIFPVLLAAVLSALSWDFFFIPPRFTFQVGETQDALMLLMYFLVALINTVLTYKVRKMQKKMREEEERASLLRLYNTILNSLSHELRTPISAIVGATDNLLSDAGKLTPADRESLLTEISASSLRLNRQVENLLSASRLESGIVRTRLDWCDIGELLHTVINNLESYTQAHEVVIDLPQKLPLVRLDFGLMEQALSNLVLNATQYTPAGTVITLRASCTEKECTFIVEDNGPGFPEGEMSKVFDRFYRLDNKRAGGTGLGLSIVKGFVEAHHGTVTLEPPAPHGAHFTIEIPTETSYLSNLKNE